MVLYSDTEIRLLMFLEAEGYTTLLLCDTQPTDNPILKLLISLKGLLCFNKIEKMKE